MEKVAKAGYFEKEKKEQQKGEEAFFKQGEKPEVGSTTGRYVMLQVWKLILVVLQKKKVASARASDQKAVDKALLMNIKKEPFLINYLGSTFSLRKGDRPHEMKW